MLVHIVKHYSVLGYGKNRLVAVFTLFGLIDNGCERFSIENYCQCDLHIHRSILILQCSKGAEIHNRTPRVLCHLVPRPCEKSLL